MIKIQEYIDSLNGYCIKNTHFHLSESIHTEDFYFAKQLFQNSYYVTRIAYWIASEIDKHIKKHNNVESPKPPITLVGYELYSVLVLELVRVFLKSKGYEEVNHIYLTIDMLRSESPLFFPVKKNYITIVPISSTGGTTQKIVNKIEERHNGRIHLCGFQIIKAYDIDNSIISEEKTNDSGSLLHTLLILPAKWHHPSTCPKCFVNDDPNVESKGLEPLINTDDSNLVPSFLFAHPNPKATTNLDDYDEKKKEKIDKSDEFSFWGCSFNKANYKESLLYMQIQINGDRRVYSNSTSVFIERNRSNIENWLRRLRNDIFKIKEDDSIIILAPNNESNISFVSLVNSVLFNSSATIILHQANTDFVENFGLLNSHYFNKNTISHYRLFFVDNDLVTGNTFFKVYDDYRFASEYDKPLESAIFLFNYSSADINRRVVRAAKGLHTFISANYTTLRYNSINDRIEKEVNRYWDLSKETLYERYRKEFYGKANKLKNPYKDYDGTKKERHLRMFIAVHNIHEYLYNLKDWEGLDINSLISSCIPQKDGNNKHEFEKSIIKVLCQAPFTFYLSLHPKVFSWITAKLIEIQNAITNTINSTDGNTLNEDIILSDELVNNLKFHIRRAVIINNTYIVCRKFLETIGSLIDALSASKHRTNTEPEKLLFFGTAELKDLHFFLVRQYIEMIHKMDYSPKKLADNLKSIEFVSVAGKQFQGMLLVECATVLNKIYKTIDILTIEKIESIKKKYRADSENKVLLSSIEKTIVEIIHDTYSKIGEKYLSNLIPKYINIKKIVPLTGYNEAFVSFIWIKLAINHLFTVSPLNIDLDTQTNNIFSHIKTMGASNECGSFMIIKDCFKQKQIVYDSDVNGRKALNNFDSLDYFDKWLDGEGVDENTILSLYKDNRHWYDEFGEIFDETSLVNITCFENCNKILLLKICSQRQNKNSIEQKGESLGVIGLYWAESRDIESLKSYLLLLRDDIARFIEYHHQNNEFVQLRLSEERKKYISLFGHGQLTMEKLAENDADTFKRIVSVMKTLQYIVAFQTDSITAPLNRNSRVKETIEKQFPPTVLLWNGDGENTVNDLIKKIEGIAKQIYKSNIIEMDLCDSEFEISSEKNEFMGNEIFNLNIDIILFIMFELIVNAKKNRFIIEPDYLGFDMIRDRISCFKNKLTIVFENCGNSLRFGVRATSTPIKDETKKIIEGDKHDNYKPVAGVYLINEILKIMGGKKIQVESDEMEGYDGFIYQNTISVCLKSL